jgi:hypothetical protein
MAQSAFLARLAACAVRQFRSVAALRLRTIASLRPQSRPYSGGMNAPCVLALLGSQTPRTSREYGLHHRMKQFLLHRPAGER